MDCNKPNRRDPELSHPWLGQHLDEFFVLNHSTIELALDYLPFKQIDGSDPTEGCPLDFTFFWFLLLLFLIFGLILNN